jgi:hypothetical protein
MRSGRAWQIVMFLVVAGSTFALSVGTGGQRMPTPGIPPTTLNGAPGVEVTLPAGPGGLRADLAVLGAVGSADGTAPLPDADPTAFFASSLIGDDGNDGQTAETPWLSLQAGLDRLEPGHTLYLMDGEYSELKSPGDSHYTVNVDGTPEGWIRVAAAPGHRPELVPSSGNGMSITGNYVEVSGLTVRGEGFGPDNAYGWGLLIRDSHHVRLVGNTVFDMPVGGIAAIESANLEIYGNEVYDNAFWGTEQGSGISVWHARDHDTEPDDDGYHDKIIGNIAYRNENKVFSRWAPGQDLITDGNGIIVDESKDLGYTGRTLVANNVAFDNGGRGILVNRASRVDIVFNTTYQNARTKDLAGGAVEVGVLRSFDVRLLNNLAWSRPGSPGLRIIEAEQVIVGGNVFVTTSPSGGETELDLVTSEDPGVVAANVDPALADFTPLPDSLLVDRGIDAEPRVSFDANGSPRTSATADVGAYELVAR